MNENPVHLVAENGYALCGDPGWPGTELTHDLGEVTCEFCRNRAQSEDTSRCPVGETCCSCGQGDDLAVAVADTPLGVVCLTLCASCEQAARTPSLSCVDAALRALTHAAHTGITDLADDVEANR
jgi:hypothetical protein